MTAAAEGFLVGEVDLDEAGVHDGRLRARRAVAFGERPAPQQRHAERVEVGRPRRQRHDGREQLDRRRRSSLDHAEGAPVAESIREVRDCDLGHRLPQIGEPRKPEPVRHDADHFRRLAVDPDGPADDGPVAAVPVPPDVPGEQDDRRRGALLVRGPEVPAEDGRLAEQAQAGRGDEDALQPRRRPVVLGDGGRRRLVGGQRAERRRRVPNVLEIGVRDAPRPRAAVAGRDMDHPLRGVDGQAPRRQRIEHREELRGDAHPESQHEDGDDRERRPAGEQAHREPQVLPGLVQPPRAARVAALLLDVVEAAELDPRAPARLVLGQAGPHVLGRLPLDMVAQLAVQLAFEPVAVPEAPPPAHRAPPPAVPRIRPTASASRAQLSVCSCSRARPFGVSR